MLKNIIDYINDNKINLYSMNDLQLDLNKNIFNSFTNNELFLSKLYNMIKSIYVNNSVIITDNNAESLLLNQPFTGNLNIEIPLEREYIKSLLLQYNSSESYRLENIFNNNILNNIINNLYTITNQYYYKITEKLNDLKLSDIVPERTKLNNNIYIVNPDEYIYYEFINSEKSNINMKNIIKYNISTYYDSIMFYCYFDIDINCNKIEHHISSEINNYTTFTKFVFLKILFVPDKKIEIQNINKSNNIFSIYNTQYVINRSLSNLILSFIKYKNNIKEINNIKILLSKYKDNLSFNINNLKIRNVKVLLNKYRNLFNSVVPLESYFAFRFTVNNDMFIYSTEDILDYGEIETKILDICPNKIKKALKNFITIIDNILYNYIEISISNEENVLDKMINYFNLNKIEIDKIKKNKNTYNRYLRIYYLTDKKL
ncbi:hypothetical protein AMV033 [Betaentomopoxvirus amoorei]|uniref:AMV033 n=1 Tax=Amsacta moorei entomopoxvirus TaxID=28321 RepID=Q9EN15_AMEPV|nr:hypothetical protein AMV033 [Amsacta moorei entomopoxvirus]AAG02739.1 AMV033 [Amsacta moorei entomopoxvirus]